MHRIAFWFLGLCLMTATAAMRERCPSGWQRRPGAHRRRRYQTLVFGVVNGDASEIVAFGKLDDGSVPDGDTVYEIGSITRPSRPRCWPRRCSRALDARRAGGAPVAGLQDPVTERHRDQPRATRHPAFRPAADADQLLAERPGQSLRRLRCGEAEGFLADYPLPRDPGASYEYSNLGFGLLGYALAQAAQTSYGTVADQKILKPLGMTMSGTAFSAAMRSHLAAGHDAKARRRRIGISMRWQGPARSAPAPTRCCAI